MRNDTRNHAHNAHDDGMFGVTEAWRGDVAQPQTCVHQTPYGYDFLGLGLGTATQVARVTNIVTRRNAMRSNKRRNTQNIYTYDICE